MFEGVDAPPVRKTVQSPVGDTSVVVGDDDGYEDDDNFATHFVEGRNLSQAAADFELGGRRAGEEQREAVAKPERQRSLEGERHVYRDIGLKEGEDQLDELRCFTQRLKNKNAALHSACAAEKAARAEEQLKVTWL